MPSALRLGIIMGHGARTWASGGPLFNDSFLRKRYNQRKTRKCRPFSGDVHGPSSRPSSLSLGGSALPERGWRSVAFLCFLALPAPGYQSRKGLSIPKSNEKGRLTFLQEKG